MRKGVPGNLVLVLALGLIFGFCVWSCFAEESITITTYYPSPYGSYNEMQLYPHSAPVTACNSSTKGTMYYDSDDDQIKTCNGSIWQTMGGGGARYVGATVSTYNGSDVGGYDGGNNKCNAQYPSSRMCVASDFILGRPTAIGWYSTYIPSWAGARMMHDCRGWTATGVAQYSGAVWGRLGIDEPNYDDCTALHRILCCR